MPQIILHDQPREFPDPLTIEQLLQVLGHEPKRVAVEVNLSVIPRHQHAQTRLTTGDRVEIVSLVGGGQPESPPEDKPLVVGKFQFRSRLFTGTGKYTTFDLMRDSLAASGCEVTTVAVRRERLIDSEGRNLLDYLDLKRYTILPNTAGCFNAEDAIRHARLARELLTNLENPGADWVKLECLADKKTLLPDPIDTLKATEQLVKEGFQVLVYTSDDPVLAKRLKDAGAASVMPAGSPIGSGQGVLNPNNIRIILEYLKAGDPDYPVIIDAGVGTASDVAAAMELGCDGVLLNTAIASAKDPVRMAWAMRYACEAGRMASLSGRIPKKLYATASSPIDGMIAPTSRHS
ncbi:sulfur carrier protein ThiS [Tuwongella immobilis]|uniref:Thiazole synthase n=1 Tax=Tuwongella immobilis TaxID=692036 RepID=A0A6C2YSC0_9BACT|nr:sulfur carrier protein ThiS [Tuwongella immobilis]VIP04033.1 thiazole synthase : Thiazole synthase OS=Singulisphaera acidiphila (strain ATCC BAA-1392 / DSM 18658 / VKM B-2454 / MOB10) GN=thiG PE=3 SV=1: ThiS: ThiG [Tuwongella immobilis]VTS05433.1 thiazole synthase : Thiazole synthase OS=Singulisphaera acidiphila (strain ATCC BAA-1392 / DSM 18658 / VKM B-2454 / MOB10) GN=thiG PE=3 SV=1: ThiS: ThiG [Tuwongella immobilis]